MVETSSLQPWGEPGCLLRAAAHLEGRAGTALVAGPGVLVGLSLGHQCTLCQGQI